MAPAFVLGAHLLPPDVRRRLARPRLFAELDRLRAGAGCRAVWIGAAAGCGKTTLAASWLAARAAASLWLRLDEGDRDPATFAGHLRQALQHAAGARAVRRWPAFTREHLACPALQIRRCARRLFGALPDEAVAVLDDVQAWHDDATLAPLLRSLVDEVRPGQCLVLLSQRPWPAALAELRADARVAVLDAASLAFDAHEVQAWSAMAGHVDAGDAWLAHSAGWPLALGWLAAGLDARDLPALLSSSLLAGLDAADRAALDRAAWCPVADAATLSADEVHRLRRLAHSGVPIDAAGTPRAPRLRLHDLLRQALQQHQRETREPGELAATLADMARRLQAVDEDGAVALQLEAATLDTAHVGGADATLCTLAPAWLASARHAALRARIERLPEARRSAALWFWLAQAELPRSPGAARACADRALALLGPDEAGLAARCHALAIATHFQSFDDTRPLAARVSALRALGVAAETCDVRDSAQAGVAVGVWSALFLRQPTHPDCAAWQARVRALLHEPVDANIRLRAAMLLAKQSWYQGRHADLIALPALARIEPGRAGVQPYGRLLEGLMRQYVAWAGADWPAGLRCTHEALTVADEVGIHLLDAHLRLHGACFAALRGDDAQARAWLDAVAGQADPARRMEAWHHFTVRGWLALRGGDAAAAEAASRVAIDAAQAMGPDPHAMALALRCHALQTLDDAPALRTAQRELVALADATENRLAALHLHLLNAHTAAGSGDRDGCLRQLRQALRVARACALWAPIGIEPRATAALLNEAIAAGVERDAACRLARAMRLAPPPQASVHWPWPVRVRTLGGFAIEVDDRAVSAEGKQQKRPLELLQALVALGGSAGRERLADLLWPEAEGDRALDALEVALRRLRQLLGGPDAVPLRGGRLTLDPHHVWVDVLRAPLAARRPVDAFLPDQTAHWAVTARERLARGAPLSASLAA